MKKVILFTASLAASLLFASCSSEASETATHNEAHDAVAHVEEVVEDKVEEMAEPEVQTIKLEEIAGEFTTKELTLEEGTYSFEVTNNGIDHPVAFVLAPSKEDVQESDFIADAMLTTTVADGETASSKKAVTLEKGEYVYFCPMNPTPQYKLTVK